MAHVDQQAKNRSVGQRRNDDRTSPGRHRPAGGTGDGADFGRSSPMRTSDERENAREMRLGLSGVGKRDLTTEPSAAHTQCRSCVTLVFTHTHRRQCDVRRARAFNRKSVSQWEHPEELEFFFNAFVERNVRKRAHYRSSGWNNNASMVDSDCPRNWSE